MEVPSEVPSFLTGSVTEAYPSFCMDKATHLLHVPSVGHVRLLATNAEALKSLQDYTDAKVAVTVAGYPRRSANCEHLEVYAVWLATAFAEKAAALS